MWRVKLFLIGFLIGGNMGRHPEPLPDIAIDFGIETFVNLQEEYQKEQSLLKGGNVQDTHCSYCHSLVAPHDPEKIKWGTLIFHGKCFKTMKVRAEERKEDVTLIWRGKDSYLAFKPKSQVFH